MAAIDVNNVEFHKQAAVQDVRNGDSKELKHVLGTSHSQPQPPSKSKSHRRPLANGFLPSLITHFENGNESNAQSPSKARKGAFAAEVVDDQSKMCYFYQDGEKQFQSAVKLAVQAHRYKKIDTLLNELTDRMPDMTYGVRAIYTPSGKHYVSSVDQLVNEGHYVCTSNTNRVRGVDLQKLSRTPRWSNARPPSGRRLYSMSLRIYKDSKKKAALNGNDAYHSAPPVLNGQKDGRMKKDCKKIYVRRLSDPKRKQVYFLNMKSTVDFDDFLIGKSLSPFFCFHSR